MAEKPLTDREKLIISTIVISQQDAFEVTPDQRASLVREYRKVLTVPNTQELFDDLKKEYTQLQNVIEKIECNETADFDGAFSELNNREKYISYNVMLSLAKDLPIEVYYGLKSTIMTLLGVTEDTKLLDMVRLQMNESFSFIKTLKQKV